MAVEFVMGERLDPVSAVRSGRAGTPCGHCGRPWFGVVAFCPYCGHRSEAVADKPAKAVTAAPAPSPSWTAGQPRDGQGGAKTVLPGPTRHPPASSPSPSWIAGPARDDREGKRLKLPSELVLNVLIAAAGALVLVGISMTRSVPAAPSAQAAVAEAPDAAPQAPPSPPAQPEPPQSAQPAQPAPPPPAPPPRGRALCSEADETAGLCKSRP